MLVEENKTSFFKPRRGEILLRTTVAPMGLKEETCNIFLPILSHSVANLEKL